MKRFSIAVVLPTDFCSKKYELRIGDGGNVLEIKVVSPAEL